MTAASKMSSNRYVQSPLQIAWQKKRIRASMSAEQAILVLENKVTQDNMRQSAHMKSRAREGVRDLKYFSIASFVKGMTIPNAGGGAGSPSSASTSSKAGGDGGGVSSSGMAE